MGHMEFEFRLVKCHVNNSPGICLYVMIGLVTQSGAVLIKAAVLWRHKHTHIKLLIRTGHVHEEETVPDVRINHEPDFPDPSFNDDNILFLESEFTL